MAWQRLGDTSVTSHKQITQNNEHPAVYRATIVASSFSHNIPKHIYETFNYN